MLPSRCVRCGAMSRDVLCGPCVDYLVAYRPLWLDPALLPGPSLLDYIGSREVAVLSADLSSIEWRSPASEPTPADAMRLVRLLSLGEGARPAMSVGDAEVFHAFLQEARRSPPADLGERGALASLYRYLSTSDWMPTHLAREYRLRADMLDPPAEPAEDVPEALTRLESVSPEPPLPQAAAAPDEPAEERASDLPSMDLEAVDNGTTSPAPEPPPPEPVPLPEPPLPEPVPIPGPEPVPEPEPEPEPEGTTSDAARFEEIEASRRAIEKERLEVEAWARSRAEDLRTKELAIADREVALASKQQEVEAQAQAATDRLVALEKDEVRRGVLRFLGTIPGMSEAQADVIATAFPDMDSLQAADEKALTQCRGVTEALARAIRYELVPGEVEEEQRATRLREEAQAFIEEGDYEAALACYDRLLRETPQEVGIWFDRAELLVLLGRPEEALQCYTRVLDFDRKNRQAWFERANLLFGLGRLADAVDALRETLRIDPSKSGDLVQKAEQLRRDGHPNEAAILFQAVLDTDPTNARAILGLGDSFLDLGDTDASEALFTRALGKNPQNPPILFRKGELLDRKGRWGAAIQYYNRAIALQWNFVDPWIAKARILLDHDRTAESLECFTKVVSLDSKRVEAWAGKARAHAVLGDRTQAEAALARASEIDPSHPAVRAARDAIGPGSPEESQPGPLPEPVMDLPSLAKAFAEIEEDSEEGRTTAPAASPDFGSFVESIEPEQEDAHVLVQLAELALEGGDAQMALLRYEQAIEREPRNADAWTGRGVALQQLERFREALDAYDRALGFKPDHPLARKWRATCVRHLERGANP